MWSLEGVGHNVGGVWTSWSHERGACPALFQPRGPHLRFGPVRVLPFSYDDDIPLSRQDMTGLEAIVVQRENPDKPPFG